jgi:4-aminobutyrate aminotransferase
MNANDAMELLAFGQRHVAKGLSRLKEDIIISGEGSWVTLADGMRAIDFSCGIGVTNLGYFLI